MAPRCGAGGAGWRSISPTAAPAFGLSCPPATASCCRGWRARYRSASLMRSPRCARSRSMRSTSRSRQSSEQSPRRTPHGALPALPVGRDRPAARVALRRGGRRVRARDRRGGRGEGARARRAHHGRVRRLDGGPARRHRAEYPPDRALRARRGRGAGRGRDRRGRHAREALRHRRRGEARKRHPWAHREGARHMTTEESLARAEELLARLEKARAELEQLSQADDAERALDVLTELAELSKAIEEELQRAKREAEADAES